MPWVKLLAIVPEKILQLEALLIEESPLDSDVIANAKRAETIDIRPPRVVRERNQDRLSGLSVYFEGAALEVYPRHSPIHCLNSGSGSGSIAPTLISIPDAFLDAD